MVEPVLAHILAYHSLIYPQFIIIADSTYKSADFLGIIMNNLKHFHKIIKLFLFSNFINKYHCLLIVKCLESINCLVCSGELTERF